MYLQNEGVSRHETLQLFLFLFPLQHIKRPALQNKQVVLLRMAFRARKVLGTFEKQGPAPFVRPPAIVHCSMGCKPPIALSIKFLSSLALLDFRKALEQDAMSSSVSRRKAHNTCEI